MQMNAQEVCTQTFSTSGSDNSPTVLTINLSDLNCYQGTIVSAKLVNPGGSLVSDYCGSWYNFTLDAGGDPIEGCGADFDQADITGVDTVTITSGDMDGYTDTVSIVIDVEVTYELPSCPTPYELTAVPASDSEAVLSWTALGDETSWNLEWGTEGFELGSGTQVLVSDESNYTLSDLTYGESYEFYVQAVCSDQESSEWSESYAFTLDYCTSVPTSNDNEGITNVNIQGTDFPTEDVTYFDHSGTAVEIDTAAENTMDITFGTSYTYNAHVWIDFNKDLVFDNETELVYSGESIAENPAVLNATFTVPSTLEAGDYRMRLGTADSGQATPNPCYNGSYGVTLDFTITVAGAEPDTMDWYNLNWLQEADNADNGSNTALTVEMGVPVTAYAQGYEAGVTDSEGQGEGVSCWIGYSMENTDPSTWADDVWVEATYVDEQGNNDNFTASFDGFNPGTYYFASRWSLNGAEYTYGGYNNPWGEEGGVSIELTVSSVANDECDGAQMLTMETNIESVDLATQVPSTVYGATDSGVEAPSPSCGGTPNDDVWFTFEALTSDVNITVFDNFDGVVELLSGSCDDLVHVACKDIGENPQISVEDLVPGETYYVRVFSYLGTVPPSDPTFNIAVWSSSSTSSLEDNTIDGFVMSPNPVNDRLNLKADYDIQMVNIFNALGQEVMTLKPFNNNVTLNVDSLAEGVYIIKVQAGSQFSAYQFIKQ